MVCLQATSCSLGFSFGMMHAVETTLRSAGICGLCNGPDNSGCSQLPGVFDADYGDRAGPGLSSLRHAAA